MNITQVIPHYSSLPQADIDTITALISQNGFAPVLAAIGDILTQSAQCGASKQVHLAFSLGGALASAFDIDREFPPAA